MNREQVLIALVIILSVALAGTLYFFNKENKVEVNKEEVNVIDGIEIETGIETGIISSISSEEVIDKLKNEENFILLDVRTQEEYDAFHIVGAILFPLQALSEQSLADFELGDKNAEIVIYCSSGNRSAQAYKLMSEWGYTNIKDLTGGIISFDEANKESNSDLITY